MVRAFLLGSWALMGLLLMCACVHSSTEELARVDAAEALAVPKVDAEIQAHMQRNGYLDDALYYIDAVRRIGSDSTRIKVSSLVYQTQVTALNPCALTQMNKHWVLVKTGACNPDAKMDSLIRRYAQTHLIDNTRLYYRVDPNGDSIILNKLVIYDPEILYITLYKDNIARVLNSPY